MTGLFYWALHALRKAALVCQYNIQDVDNSISLVQGSLCDSAVQVTGTARFSLLDCALGILEHSAGWSSQSAL